MQHPAHHGMTIIPPGLATTAHHGMYNTSPTNTSHVYLPTTMNAGSVDPYFQLLQQQRQQEAHDASKTLFLGDLSYFCTEENLCTLFIPYGRIVTVRVRRGVTGESLMHGFIALDSHEAALKAIHDLDGAEFMGRNMRVQLSSDGQRPSPISKESFVQIHVSFISKQLHLLVTEKVLRDIFAPFGRIADVTIKKHTMIQKQNRQSGYGFVYYFDVDAANHAMAVLKQNTIMDITLDCSISYKSQHDKVPSRHNSGNWDMNAMAAMDPNALYNEPRLLDQPGIYSNHTSPAVSRSSSGNSFYRTTSNEAIMAPSPMGSLARPGSGRFNVGSSGVPLPPPAATTVSARVIDPYTRAAAGMPSPLTSPHHMQQISPTVRRTVSGGHELFYGEELEADLNRLSLRSQSMSSINTSGYASGMTSLSNSGSLDYVAMPPGYTTTGGRSPTHGLTQPVANPRVLLNPHSRTPSAHNLLQPGSQGPSPVASMSGSYDHYNTATVPGIGIGMLNTSDYDETDLALMRTVSEQQQMIRQNHAILMQQQTQLLAQQQALAEQQQIPPAPTLYMERRGMISRADSELSVASSGSRINSFGSQSSISSSSGANFGSTPQSQNRLQRQPASGASSYESFYGEPIATVSLNSSGYMKDLDSLLGMPSTTSAAAAALRADSPVAEVNVQKIGGGLGSDTNSLVDGIIPGNNSGASSLAPATNQEMEFSWMKSLDIREEELEPTSNNNTSGILSDTSSL